MSGAVLALIEGPGSPAGDTALGLAARLCGELRGSLEVCILGSSPATVPACDRAYVAESREGRPLTGAVRALLEDAVLAVVAQDSPLCGEVLGRLGAHLGTPVVGQTLSASVRDGAIEVMRSVESGKRSAKLCLSARPALLLADPEATPPVPQRFASPSQLTVLHVGSESQVHLVEERLLAPADIDLADTDVVVAGGRGLGGPDGFLLLEELAGLLNGAVGASRVAVDLGWAPRCAQVGMTGKTVAPRLYLAFGISGAVHHTLGMKDSRYVVAVNSDPAAPMLRLADVGIVADATEVLRELIADIRRRAAGSASPVFAAAS